MKKLLLIPLLLLALNVQAQEFSFGSPNFQGTLSVVDDFESFNAGAFIGPTLFNNFKARLGLSGGALVHNIGPRNDDRMFFNVSPTLMVGYEFQLDRIPLGIYTGYRSYITTRIDHHQFIPISISLSLK